MNLSLRAVLLPIALLVLLAAPTLYAQGRFAVVDLQRALNETEDGRRAKARLKKLFKRRQTALDGKQGKLKAMKEEIEKRISIWNESTKQKKLQEYQKLFVELQSSYVEYQRELAQQEGRLTRSIIARMERILRRIGQSEGYTMIVERNEGGVVWVPSNLDLTDVVIQRYNAGEGRNGSATKQRRSGTKARTKRSSN